MTAPTAKSETIRNRYDRISAVYDFLEAPMEAMAGRWRADITGEVEGRVLEVGVGTGKNIPYYGDDVDLVGIDFSPRMLAKARRKFEGTRPNLTLLEMDVQELEFEDATFDGVLTSCVFCSVPLPVAGLEEIRRVCRPGGRIVMLEHVRSEKPLLGPLMDLLNPIPLHLYGANINRDTLANLRKAGFTDIQVTDLWLDIFKKIIIINT